MVAGIGATGGSEDPSLEHLPSLGTVLREYRERALLTQEQLAARAGMGVRTIRRLETDHGRPRASSLGLLATALGLSEPERSRVLAATQGRSSDDDDDGPDGLLHPHAAPVDWVPRQLPSPPAGFTGRVAELMDLDQARDFTSVVITSIDGMAGIGKTALAVHAAHQLAGHYPDGQLFLDLHGYTADVAPVEPAEALERMLRALGVPGARIPSNLDERAALYRSLLASRKVLIVLDNAAREAQLVPLLPGTPGCLVLVTSRRRMLGVDSTRTLSLDLLPINDAVALLASAVGNDRMAAESPATLAEVAELCGRLPLAIRIAAARLRSRPAWAPAHLVELLRDHQHRLTALHAGPRSVAATLDLSYRELAPDAQRAYRLLALHPGADLDAYSAAALTAATLDDAARLTGDLLDAQLLQEPSPRRFQFHDLVRDHARATAKSAGTENEQRAAISRLLDHYRHTALVAMNTIAPADQDRRPDVPTAATPTPTLSNPTQARAWLDAELPGLLASAQHAAEHDWPEYAMHLSAILHMHFRVHRNYAEAEALHRHALAASRAASDQAGEADAWARLGAVQRLQGRMGHARDSYERALAIALAVGHLIGECTAHVGLGEIHWFQGRLDLAAADYATARELAHLACFRSGEFDAQLGLGLVRLWQGLPAANEFEQALAMARGAADPRGQQMALNGLGQDHQAHGRLDLAIGCFEEAFRIGDAHGERRVDPSLMAARASAHRKQGRTAEAVDLYHQILDLAREIGSRNWEYEAVQGLGKLELAAGRPETALAHHQAALVLATDLGQLGDVARAHDGLAHAHRALDQPEQAREHWSRALDIVTDLGIETTEGPEAAAATIRTHLSNLSLNPQERRANAHGSD